MSGPYLFRNDSWCSTARADEPWSHSPAQHGRAAVTEGSKLPPEVSLKEGRVPKIQLPLENKGNICVLSSGDVNGNILWVWGCFGAAQALHHVLKMMGQTGMLLAGHMGHELVLLWDDFRMSPKG